MLLLWEDDVVLPILEKIGTEEHERAFEIKSLLSDEIWNRYQQMGLEGLREQVLLAERLRNLKRRFNDAFKQMQSARSQAAKEAARSKLLQSEADGTDGGGGEPE